MSEPGWPGY